MRKNSALFEIKENACCVLHWNEYFIQKEFLKYRKKVVINESFKEKSSLIVAANKREGKWDEEVNKCLSNVIDVASAKARYHPVAARLLTHMSL